MLAVISQLLIDESGATAVEYGLIAALVSVAGILGMEAMGTSLSSMFQTVSSQIDGALQTSQGN
jgi:pilus assembly protein Flp/PilA